MFIDTHCHLDHPSLLARLQDVFSEAFNSGVTGIIVPGVDPGGWKAISSLAGNSHGVHAAFGLHPMLAGFYDENLLEALSSYTAEAVAIGEIGLDYSITDVPRDQQIAAFRGQLGLAVKSGLPVLVHCRRAFSDALVIMKEEKIQRVGGIMHAFSGSYEIAKECVRLGLSISISGTVTYRNAKKPVEVVEKLLLDHLVLETDSPDMTPEPYRGRDNEPAFLIEIARKIAEIKGIDIDEVGDVTTRNAKKIFRINK
jgi:TatD DNase family protein